MPVAYTCDTTPPIGYFLQSVTWTMCRMSHFVSATLQSLAMDAAEVCKNKPNVYADLSGLAVGLPDPDAFMERYRGYVDYLRTWLGFLDNYEKVMWGTDWPLVNLERYIELMAAIVPDEAHDQFFYQTAATVYHKLPALIEGSE